jgi:adenylate cyclase
VRKGDHRTVLRAKGEFLFRSVDRISPKGFATKFPIFELRGKLRTAGEQERQFCEEWEKAYAALDSIASECALVALDDFLKRHPDDRVALYHLERVRGRTRQFERHDGTTR